MPPAAINTGVDRSGHEGQSTPPPHHHHRHEPRQLALGERTGWGNGGGHSWGWGFLVAEAEVPLQQSETIHFQIVRGTNSSQWEKKYIENKSFLQE